MRAIILIGLIVISCGKYAHSACKSSKAQCVNGYDYRVCVNVLNNAVLVGSPGTCPEGYICNDDGYFPCVEGWFAPSGPPECPVAGNHPGPTCYQYYECVPNLWWFEPKLQTCPYGYGYRRTTQECVLAAQIYCEMPAITGPPECPTAGKSPAPDCDQYYECVPNLWWFEPKLQSCDHGYGYDPYSTECVPAADVNCPVEPLPIGPPECPGPSLSSGPICTQYYECVSVWWWFEPRLYDCPEGQGFDPESAQCIDGKCSNTNKVITTTVVTTSSPSTTPSTPSTTTSSPSTTTSTSVPTTSVSTTTVGTTTAVTTSTSAPTTPAVITTPTAVPTTTPTSVVSTSTSAPTTLAPITTPTTAVPTTTVTTPPSVVSTSTSAPTTSAVTTTTAVVIGPPACSGPSKSPGPQINQYYECIPYLWWFQPQLNTCPDGQIFDAQTLACVASSN